MRIIFLYLSVIFFLGTVGCTEADPQTTDIGNGDKNADAGSTNCTASDYAEDMASCTPQATDYQPRVNRSEDDNWDNCISDSGQYHRIEESVSSIARVAAYDAIGNLLWTGDAAPSPKDFVDARILFEEEQGLGSRVARRYDVHYTPPREGSCDEQGVKELNPDYCVGPSKLQPVIVDAFAKGAEGDNPVINAARIQAALEWFFYVSAIKEATTCTEAPKDCDSSWAYYTGGTPRDAPAGLAAEMNALAPETYNRAFDGVLAVRCWRDLDPDVPAVDLSLRDVAIGQLDRALLKGMSILIRQRFVALTCKKETLRNAALEALRILVPLFDRETRARDQAAAELLLAEIAKTADALDVDKVVKTLDTTYPCP